MTPTMNRRGFLGTILAIGAAPAIVRAESLMKIWTPKLVAPDLAIVLQQYSALYGFTEEIGRIERTQFVLSSALARFALPTNQRKSPLAQALGFDENFRSAQTASLSLDRSTDIVLKSHPCGLVLGTRR